jgi:hypothetical protein
LKPATLPRGTRQLIALWLTDTGGYATGDEGTVLTRSPSGWVREPTGLPVTKALHAVWVDPEGGVWAVGGDVLVPPLGEGVMIHKGKPVATSYVVEDGGLLGAGGTSGSGTDSGVKDASVDSGRAETGAPAPGIEDAGSLPGKVRCGTQTCSLPGEKCCADRDTGIPTGCVAQATPCDPQYPTSDLSADITCDENADCPAAESCCLDTYLQVGGLVQISCQKSCYGPQACVSRDGCAASEACMGFRIDGYHTCQTATP